MKLLVYIWPDGHIDIGNPNLLLKDGTTVPGQALSAMMGSGGVTTPDSLEWEITKRQRNPSVSEALAREYATALCTGGLTETEALGLIARNDLATRPGCTYQIIDKADDEVWDRYFRNAWEWSD